MGGLSVPEVVDGSLAGRSYAWLSPDLVRRIASAETPKAKNTADAIKRTKRKLHQVFGAYVLNLKPEPAIASIQQASAADGTAALAATARRLMAGHASSRERLPELERFYREVFAVTGVPATLLDVACGLGPLAAPWMDLPCGTRIIACDVDRRIVEIVDSFLTAFGLAHDVTLCDVAQRLPDVEVDVALVLKTLPCLEQQAAGAGASLLDRLPARHVVVSFPTRSLSGAGRGMEAHYRGVVDALLATRALRCQTLPFSRETVYVLTRTDV